MIRRPPRSTRTDTLSLHDALPIYQPQPDEDGYGRQQVVEVRPQVALALAGIRRLQVHYLAHARVNRGDVQRTGGFQRHLVARIAQFAQQDQATLLRQRLAAGHAYMPRTVRGDLGQDFVDRVPVTAMERVFGVAPDAAQRAAGE